MPNLVTSIDTETFLIRPGVQAPPMVCLQWRDTGGGFGIVHGLLDRRAAWLYLRELLDPGSESTITGHNVAFDMCVIAAWKPELLPLIFEAYESGRIVCSLQAERLLDIAEGREAKLYDLGAVAARYPSVPPADKNDPWRLRYSELADVPVSEWPVEAKRYALGDVATQLAVYLSQVDRAYRLRSILGDDPLIDLPRQSAADFWLKLTSAWGVHTDLAAVRVYESRELEILEGARAELVRLGLVRADAKGTRNVARAREVMAEACARAGVSPTLTEKGEIALDSDSIELIGDETLSLYQAFGAAKSVLSRIQRLKFGATTPIQPRFTCLVATGRTSCSQGDAKPGQNPETVSSYGFQLQNPPRVEGCRECFVPRPGYWFASCDYTGMELRTWGFACLRLVGFSRMAEVLVSGNDPHADLGARLSGWTYQQGIAALRGEYGPEVQKDFKDNKRQVAKIGNFGFPGGMGVDAFVKQARAQYGVILPRELASNLRDAWRENWPESKEYFALINRLLGDHGSATIQHLLSGRFRGGVSYCEAANSFFQGLAADIAKAAGFRISRGCYVESGSPLYGSRIWNFAHDEFLLEVPADPFRATCAAVELQRIMVETAREWMPELSAGIEAEPSLSLRWSKGAKTNWAKVGPYAGCMIPSEWDSSTGLPKGT